MQLRLADTRHAKFSPKNKDQIAVFQLKSSILFFPDCLSQTNIAKKEL